MLPSPRTTAVEPAPLIFRRSERARNYRLTLRRDGTAVATIPVRGTQREAERFVAAHQEWLARARERQRRRPRPAADWTIGTEVLWRGEMLAIRAAVGGARPMVSLAADVFRLPRLEGNLRPALEAQFVRRAKVELPARAWELAALTRAELKSVTVRNQRARWGSCTIGGAVSLNWRLVQSPEPVRDYIIYHELAHLWEMNHSARFWSRVEEICPGWREAERWIKRNGSLVGL
jgi:predicted metal-dependent hydrolase